MDVYGQPQPWPSQASETPIAQGHKLLWTVLVLAVIGMVAYALYALASYASDQTYGTPTPAGTIFMTLYPKDEVFAKNATFNQGYAYNIEVSTLSFAAGGPSYAVHHAFSHNKQYAI